MENLDNSVCSPGIPNFSGVPDFNAETNHGIEKEFSKKNLWKRAGLRIELDDVKYLQELRKNVSLNSNSLDSNFTSYKVESLLAEKRFFPNFKPLKKNKLIGCLSDYFICLKKLIYPSWSHNYQYEVSKKKVEVYSQTLKTLNEKLDRVSDKNSPLYARLRGKINKLENEIKYYNTIIQDVDSKFEKAKETKQNWAMIGGTALELTTADNVKLDGMYLSAEKISECV